MDILAVDPFRMRDFDGAPGESANAVNLAALHRQRDVIRAGIAGHQLDLGA